MKDAGGGLGPLGGMFGCGRTPLDGGNDGL